jgi:uncharacterized protein (DUF2141 family)
MPALLGAGAAEGDVSVTVTGLRSARGNVLACMTRRPDAFPDCDKDPQARSLTVPAGTTVELHFGPVPSGRYAISLFHDENGNGKLDKRLIMPREGYGFSRNAPVVFGPPSFASAAFDVAGEPIRQAIRMRYIF